jgi:hypothetical protein
MFVATINVPGYLPMDDDPPVFETAQEAWVYLADERERAEDDAYRGGPDADGYSDDVQVLRALAHGDWDPLGLDNAIASNGTGAVYAKTPLYDGGHDLGLAYSVTMAGDAADKP